MQSFDLCLSKEGLPQEMNAAEIDAVSGAVFLGYAALIGAAVGIYSGGYNVGSGVGHALYNMTHK
jgi:hypothetical protein